MKNYLEIVTIQPNFVDIGNVCAEDDIGTAVVLTVTVS